MSNKETKIVQPQFQTDSDFVQNYRNNIGLFATGVTVLIIEHQGKIRCMTANAVSSLSLEPVQLLICPSKSASFSELLHEGAHFSVNILGVHQEDLSNYFAGAKTEDKTSQVHYENKFSNDFTAPRLKDCIASFACRISKQYDGGDHWIVVGEVVEMYTNDKNLEPLLYFGGKYHYPAKSEDEHIQPAADPYK